MEQHAKELEKANDPAFTLSQSTRPDEIKHQLDK